MTPDGWYDSPRKPQGIVLYKDLLETLYNLPDETAGKLIKAAYIYFSEGKEPQFEVGTLEAAIFPIVRNAINTSLNRDATRQNKNILAGRYRAYKDYETKGGREPLSFEEWRKKDKKNQELLENIGIHKDDSNNS